MQALNRELRKANRAIRLQELAAAEEQKTASPRGAQEVHKDVRAERDVESASEHKEPSAASLAEKVRRMALSLTVCLSVLLDPANRVVL